MNLFIALLDKPHNHRWKPLKAASAFEVTLVFDENDAIDQICIITTCLIIFIGLDYLFFGRTFLLVSIWNHGWVETSDVRTDTKRHRLIGTTTTVETSP